MNLKSLATSLAVGILLGCGSDGPDAEGTGAIHEGEIVLPFIADDYARAVAEARERALPLFVDSWAPW